MKNFIVGANETGYHLKNVNIGRNFKAAAVKDLRRIEEGDRCPKCGSPLKLARGIEVGHIFKLGTKYSEALDCMFLDEDGKERPMVMGSYGIGISRTMAAVIEQNNDENGIIWPVSIAPFHVVIIPVNTLEKTQMEIAENLYTRLQTAGVEVILDDRDERAGVKFKDADLIGFPIRITVGKKAGDGIIEYKLRNSREIRELNLDEAVQEAVKEVQRGLEA
jgi:prolyl-tRNA synthetase